VFSSTLCPDETWDPRSLIPGNIGGPFFGDKVVRTCSSSPANFQYRTSIKSGNITSLYYTSLWTKYLIKHKELLLLFCIEKMLQAKISFTDTKAYKKGSFFIQLCSRHEGSKTGTKLGWVKSELDTSLRLPTSPALFTYLIGLSTWPKRQSAYWPTKYVVPTSSEAWLRGEV